jgi:hypothetical protein
LTNYIFRTDEGVRLLKNEVRFDRTNVTVKSIQLLCRSVIYNLVIKNKRKYDVVIWKLSRLTLMMMKSMLDLYFSKEVHILKEKYSLG